MGDKDFTPGGGASDRGYINVGQGSGDAALHNAIVNGDYSLPEPLTVGGTIDMVQGEKDVPPAIDERFAQDTDTTASTYSEYTGNGRRILIVPVNDKGDPARIVGFAGFFLPPDSCGDKNNTPCCGEYIGPVVKHGKRRGAGGTGLFVVKLFR